jgi:HAD superfamily hydrolase (TIGR01509 family)
MEGLAGVLFDMDGTLLDSEPLWDRALGALATRYGRVLSDRARQAMVGRSTRETMALFYRDLGVRDPDPHADSAFLADQMARLYATELTWRPGAAELVAEVRAAGLPAALVTTTGRRLVEVALDTLLGRSAFDVVVCGDDVTRPKPHPEPYLTAAARLGVPPAACVAIEDSPAGVQSARAAGAVVLAVAGPVPLPVMQGVHHVPTLTGVDLSYLSKLWDARGR